MSDRRVTFPHTPGISLDHTGNPTAKRGNYFEAVVPVGKNYIGKCWTAFFPCLRSSGLD